LFDIDVYLDGATFKEAQFRDPIVKGYTFNPTLFRSLGVTDYLEFCKKILTVSSGLPVSFEVISDKPSEMIRQAELLSGLGKNVYVKIPITYCDGTYTGFVIKQLTDKKINVNITAVFTLKQIQKIIRFIEDTKTIISVFAGRLFDIGINATIDMFNISEFVHEESSCRVLWASPRQSYDIINACNARCDIITMQPSLVKKLSLFNKTPESYSIDTVKMFFEDAIHASYSF